MKFYIYSLCLSLMIGSMYSCKVILSKLYGVNKIEKFDDNQYRKTLNLLVSKYDSTLCQSYIGTEPDFMKYRSLDKDNNDLSQPIQILYFYHDALKSFHVNCHAKGSLFGKLDWNYNNQFSTYYPTSSAAPLIQKNAIKLSNVLSIYQVKELKQDDDRTCIVFFWSNLLKKQSIMAFDIVVENITKHVNNKNEYPFIILINNDHSFLDF